MDDTTGVGVGDAGDVKAVVCLDVDHDGDLDVLTVDNVTGPRLYRNDGVAKNAWVEVVLVDASGRAIPEGEVWISVGDRKIRRDIRIGDVFAAQRPTAVHVGLGDTEAATALVSVRLPGQADLVQIGEIPVGKRSVVRSK